VVPFELVTVQEGPGAYQPDGVGPGVSQRFASPPGMEVVMPGEKGLVFLDVVPVWFAVISDMRTTMGVQETSGFHEVGGLAACALVVPTRLLGNRDKMETARSMERTVGR